MMHGPGAPLFFSLSPTSNHPPAPNRAHSHPIAPNRTRSHPLASALLGRLQPYSASEGAAAAAHGCIALLPPPTAVPKPLPPHCLHPSGTGLALSGTHHTLPPPSLAQHMCRDLALTPTRPQLDPSSSQKRGSPEAEGDNGCRWPC
ncbi:hypothetical protein EJ04DRAFT_116893 [Polyplosphaeria fusca]|uniref:Uncharacterized protein n=1 Tax=Polyplosphaeria fusca TaxID=682080 RepID=A0A9P4RD57_9PLEO|nr:hypothetical protein EJ04DRAFT_116893 [Polyplosphaeria fusca]